MIGVFDSGLGGLTVLKELLAALPEHDFLYFGDTARLPYGNRSPETIAQYAREDSALLLKHGAQMIVAACHTASAIAGETLKKEFSQTPPPSFPPPLRKGEEGRGIPFFDVVTPAIERARAATRNGRIGVIGTRATIGSEVYQKHFKLQISNCKLRKDQSNHQCKKSAICNLQSAIFTAACPLFVPFIEEGEINSPELKRIAKKYLRPIVAQNIDTLVLACTHYPLIASVISAVAGRRVTLVDPSREVAQEVKEYLASHPEFDRALPKNGKLEIFVSDLTPHFARSAETWLGRKVKIQKMETNGD